MLSVYQTDGTRTDYTIDWPYLDRSNIVVTANEAPRAFTFVDGHTVRVVTIFGEPLPADQTLKIMRVTPDLVDYAKFVDAANLTADDLNRARLQCLFLIQERSGGITGSVGTVIQLLQNEIETVSGALDSINQSQAILQSGLQTLDELSAQIEVIGNEADALHQQILQEIADRDAATTALAQRLDAVELDSANLRASVTSEINLLTSQTSALASKTDTIQATLDNLELSGETDDTQDDTDRLAASLINSAVASVKQDYAQAKAIATLQATINDDISAQIQTEQTARVTADEALAQQITALQAEIGDNLAQVIEDMRVTVDAVDGKVTNLNAQYVLKAQVQREDGKAIMASIGLGATSNDDMSGSEIVMMADRLVFADPASVNGTLKPLFTSGNVDGSPTFIIPSNVMGDRMYPGRLLVDGSIEGRSIAAETITGDHVKAGSIRAEQIDVSGGVNRAWNSEMVEMRTASEIARWWPVANNASAGWLSYGRDLSADWMLSGGHTAWFRHTGTTGNADFVASNSYWLSDPIVIDAGERYEFWSLCGVHRCAADILMYVYDTGGNVIQTSTKVDGVSTISKTEGFSGGRVTGNYKKIGGFLKPIAGAATARLLVRKGFHVAPDTDSYLFLTQPFLAPCNPNQTRFSPYNVSGLGTTITPSGIVTPSLSALSATIGLLRTAASGARMELESNQLRIYDENNVMRVRLGVW